VTDRPGLESGARLDIEFDPSRERLSFNRLMIIRNGVVIDKLAEARFEIFRREMDSEKGIFDGRLTAHVDLSDVRVGDIVDYSTTYEVTPVVAKNLLFERFQAEWGEPVALTRERVIWPTEKPLNIRAVRTGLTPKVTKAAGETIYLWEAANPAPVKLQENLPVDYPNFGFVQISSEFDWQPVVDALLPFYQPAKSFPADFEAKIVEIERRHAALEDRLIAALRLIQDELRYVSLSIGAGSYVPRRPEAVLASGFGDCKDKALLLVSALRRLGIEAEAALTDIDGGKALEHSLPALQAFDHVIVKAKIGERVWWLDATDYLQGGRAANIVPPNYGFALPLVASGASLEKIPEKELLEPTQSVAERFAFPRQDGEPLVLTVNTTYRNGDADIMRRRLAYASKAKLADDYLQYYNRQYPGIRSTAMLETIDDRELNILTTKETYELPSEALVANDLAKNFPLRADIGIGGMPTPTAVGRTGPIALGSPVYKSHKVIVTNLKARFSPPERADVYDPHFSLKLGWSTLPDELELEWNFRTLTERVPVEAISAYLQAVADSNRKSEWYYDFTQVDPAPISDDAPSLGVTGMIRALAAALRDLDTAAETAHQEH
jgi:transglutaminase-like putative cysteine protease